MSSGVSVIGIGLLVIIGLVAVAIVAGIIVAVVLATSNRSDERER